MATTSSRAVSSMYVTTTSFSDMMLATSVCTYRCDDGCDFRTTRPPSSTRSATTASTRTPSRTTSTIRRRSSRTHRHRRGRRSIAPAALPPPARLPVISRATMLCSERHQQLNRTSMPAAAAVAAFSLPQLRPQRRPHRLQRGALHKAAAA